MVWKVCFDRLLSLIAGRAQHQPIPFTALILQDAQSAANDIPHLHVHDSEGAGQRVRRNQSNALPMNSDKYHVLSLDA